MTGGATVIVGLAKAVESLRALEREDVAAWPGTRLPRPGSWHETE
jgi:hypothetical protein